MSPNRLLLLLIVVVNTVSTAQAVRFKGLYYEVKGKGEAVVFIHGGQMDRRMWDDQFEVFAKRFRVVRYDIRGFGSSDAPLTPYSDAGDLADLLAHLKIQRASLVGLSLGGAVATDFTLTYPDRVAPLVLTCPGLGGFPFRDPANDLRPVVEAARDESYDKAAELWLANPYMSVAMEQPRLRERLRTLARENGKCWLKNPLLNRGIKPPAVDRLGEIRARTLVIGGERDVSDIHAIVGKLAAEIPGATKRMFAGCGHIVPMEAPAEFNRVVLDFLSTGAR
jgi:pimeloyl-ACP methyl ester carboxylesterase